MKLILIVSFVFVGKFCFAQAGIEKHFKIYDTRSKQLTTIEQIAADCKNADVLFFGEEHNDSAGHYLEAAMLESLYKLYGREITLSLEMFETDCQFILDEYLDGYITEERFLKDARPWNNYKDYRPAVEFAKQNRLDIIAANPPRRYVNMVSRKGMRSLDSLPKSAKKFLPKL